MWGAYAHRHLDTNERSACLDLGSISYLRGSDSAGIAVITKKKPRSPKLNIDIRKRPDHPVDFFTQKETLDQIRKPHVTCIMGHARAATHGVINEVNSHPMREGSIIGAHNGVVKKYEPTKDEETHMTDSRKLFAAINEGTLEKVLSDLDWNASYALSFIDLQFNTLNFVRNDKRPLWFARTKGGALFWASELHMIKFALGRNSIEVDAVTELKPGTLFITDLLTGEHDTKTLNLSKSVGFFPPSIQTTTTTVIEPGATNVITKPGYFPPSDDFVQERIGHMRDYMEKTKGRKFLGYTEDTVYTPSKVPNVIDMSTWEDDLKKNDASVEKGKSVYPFLNRQALNAPINDDNPANVYQIRKFGIPQWVSFPVARSYLRHGCDYCSAKSDIEDTVYWYAPREHLCEECYELPLVKTYYKHHGDFIKNDIILDSHISLYGG